MYQVVFLRHGQSLWNAEDRFTGWVDVKLSDKGREQARVVGALLQQHAYTFDIAFTSFLQRAISTLNIVLEEMGLLWIPVYKSWKLNERHYGALQGLNKTQITHKYGATQVHEWRRSFTEFPPELNANDQNAPHHEAKYKTLTHPPLTENLQCTLQRVVSYWNENILPEIKKEKRVLVVAHGNSLRALIKHLHDISDDDIKDLNIPIGRALICHLNANFKATHYSYLPPHNL